jgi:signal transduction histidine kinase
MSRTTSLRRRIFLSFSAVVLAVVAASALTSRFLMPTFFEQRLRARAGTGGPRGPGPGEAAVGGTGQTQVPEQIQDAYDQALNMALIVGAVVGVTLALLLAVWISRRTLRSLTEMRAATSRLAAGDFQQTIGVPAESELADLAHSINALGTELAETEQTRARLVSDLAHELRNPLASIEGYMEGLIDGVLPSTNETFSTVAAEAHRLQRLTADLSLLSKAQEGALDLRRRPVDLSEVAGSVTERLEPQFISKRVELVRRLESRLPVMADSDRLHQALTNLVGNALAHTPPGGFVEVAARSGGDVCAIDVIDTGEGIPVDRLGEVFERFTRFSSETHGTGIGLDIARTIARLHDGDVVAHSEGPGTGSTFTLTLPARTSDTGHRPADGLG